MGKYLIADIVWEINFPKEFDERNFKPFIVDSKKEAYHIVNFEFTSDISKLNELNYEENGLKMYVENDIKLFDIFDKNKLVVRGKYVDNISTFQIIETFNDIDRLINMLSFMRIAEIASKCGVIALKASAVSMKDKAVIVTKDNIVSFIDMWLNEIEESILISNNILFSKTIKNEIQIYNTPWSCDNVKQNINLPLSTIVFLVKGIDKKFIDLTDEEKLLDLAYHLGIMTDTLSNEVLMQFCLDILDRVNILKYKGKIDIKEIFNKIYFS